MLPSDFMVTLNRLSHDGAAFLTVPSTAPKAPALLIATVSRQAPASAQIVALFRRVRSIKAKVAQPLCINLFFEAIKDCSLASRPKLQGLTADARKPPSTLGTRNERKPCTFLHKIWLTKGNVRNISTFQ